MPSLDGRDDVPLIGMVAYFYAELPRSRWIPPADPGGTLSRIRRAWFGLLQLSCESFRTQKSCWSAQVWEEGGRSYLLRMKELVLELGLEQSVIFTGFRTDIAEKVLHTLDIAVQPSLSENLGGTIKSLLMECPTIATRVGGLTDSVVDGKTGILVNLRPNRLRTASYRCFALPAVARQYGVAGRQQILERFTLRRTVHDLAALYERKLEIASGRISSMGYPYSARHRVGVMFCHCRAICSF